MNYPHHNLNPRLFFGAGPANVHPRVMQELARPLVSHLDPVFHELFLETRELLQYVMHTQSSMTFPVHGPGSLAMETCIANIIEPGDKIVVMNNGFYGDRLTEMAKRYGAKIISVEYAWGEALCAEDLEKALCEHQGVKAACFVHGESSTGVMSDVQSLSRVCRKYNVLSICDIVATLGGVPVLVDEWELDAVYANSQKCLSAPPGLAPLSMSDRAMHSILNRATPVQSWCLDLRTMYELAKTTPIKRFYPYTSPVHCFYALHSALTSMYEEGMERIWTRHAYNCESLTEGLKVLGLTIKSTPGPRIPLLNLIDLPAHIHHSDIRSHLSKNHNIDISDGMGKWETQTVRIAAMGQACTADMIEKAVRAVGETLQHFQKPVNIKKALNTAKKLAFYDSSTPFSSYTDAPRHALSA